MEGVYVVTAHMKEVYSNPEYDIIEIWDTEENALTRVKEIKETDSYCDYAECEFYDIYTYNKEG